MRQMSEIWHHGKFVSGAVKGSRLISNKSNRVIFEECFQYVHTGLAGPHVTNLL